MNIQNRLDKGRIILRTIICIIVLSAISIAGCAPKWSEPGLFGIEGTELPPPPAPQYDIKCYSNGNGLIYEGTAVGQPTGSTKYGFYWRDTEGRDVKVAGDCVFIRLDNE